MNANACRENPNIPARIWTWPTVFLTSLIAAVLVWDVPARAENVPLNQLPPAAQKKIEALRGSSRVLSIEKQAQPGGSVYQVRLGQPGGTNVVLVTDAGVLVAPRSSRAPLSGARIVGFGDLPMAVLSTVQSYAGASPISQLVKATLQGRTIYQASFVHDGQPADLRINTDGSLVRDAQNDQFLARYNQELGLPPQAGVSAAPTGQNHAGIGTAPASTSGAR